jgi:diguanylate cyclase (GGDEF)-like protein
MENLRDRDWSTGVGWPRILALALLLAAIGAVAYLDRMINSGFDLTLVYFAIILSGSLLLPRPIAVPLSLAVGLVASGLSRESGLHLYVNGTARLLLFGYVALLTSNWERERRRLLRQSRIDDLTGLYNLRALREQLPVWLGPAARTKRPMSILMLDMDGFKAVNDRLGHGVGNALLKEVASLLRFSVRVGDAPFRFGGDEFVVLLSDADAGGATVVARRMQELYESMGQTLQDTGLKVSFSFGIAVFPADGSTPDELLAHADQALYEAKRSGPGKIVRYSANQAA